MEIRTYHSGFDISKDLPAVHKAARKNLNCFRSAVQATENRVVSIGHSIVETHSSIEKLDVARTRALMNELQQKVDEIKERLRAEDAAGESSARVLSEKRLSASAKVEELHNREKLLEDRLTELKVCMFMFIGLSFHCFFD
ncbi:unnamed protein product [Echinostoma caproni]|uniref:Uncharacterized protein n=1 Tax=Echinostoma caproni TaxID=27848 RepID=A0A3P8INU5_9TREM|nr:unnamed protein product [Echinostoma caproni]